MGLEGRIHKTSRQPGEESDLKGEAENEENNLEAQEEGGGNNSDGHAEDPK